jgi:16S rRNA (guanine527-N7)-methyltransferase
MDFKVELEKLNISLDNDMLNKFELYYNKLIEVNSYMNLTAITEKDQVYLKHFYDSLTITKAISGDNYNILDVGAGAGFPSVPLAIVKPNVNVTIIDSLNKRINFLNDLTKYIGIDNVVALHQRAEEYIKDKRESFDYVTARAVARLNVLSELCIPYVKVGGYFVALKGNDKEEIDEARNAISILGGKIEKIINFLLPDDAGERNIVIIKKIKESPKKYPRIFKTIKDKPL